MDLAEILFPAKCLDCGREGCYICNSCLSKVHAARLFCPMCDKPAVDGFTHARCLKKYGLDGETSFWRYEGVVRKALLALKYKFAYKIANELVTASFGLCKERQAFMPKNAIIVPLPLYIRRENWRGFNQSEILCSQLAKFMNLRIVNNLLIRTKNVVSQTKLSKDKRAQNVRGVFSINPKFSKEVNNSVIIFDDVYTTGATMKEAAKTLKRFGIKQVWGLTMAS
ncbi:MAG: putative amidophosphoribosyltransferase [Candidatus Woesebacteria bacterium GW2011_GWA1_39_8]|uniref:Putative amidophosphoribosyltransferase n=1 Tax=Candidatus Woesebacteria bacterium GW2011_GWA1_39_8 TaxID=1618552 RepID=A0A0G0PMG9_9BACT|nr:MAG: putative amidophosphoribosyltransferase [Candidatus Woesebacteria bacterium GW2011_GWA1_39_8]